MQIFLILIIICSGLLAQSKDANEILSAIKDRLDKIEDYSVDIKLNVDMEYLRISSVRAKLYFKKPDLMKIDSEDFAIIPKEAINFSPTQFFNASYEALYVKSDTLNKRYVDFIKIIPLDDSTNIVITSLWIDAENNLIRKIETTTKNRGTFSALLEYNDLPDFSLPSKIVFSFNISEPDIPEIPNTENIEGKRTISKQSKNLTGTIIVEYSNYSINEGLDNSIFFNSEQNQ